jgi:hypothetical protein
MKDDPKRYVTDPCTMVYPSLFEPSSFKKEEPKYTCTLLFSKKIDTRFMKESMKAAAAAKFGSNILGNLRSLDFPLRDGDEKAQGEKESFYYNRYWMRVKSSFRPKLVNIYGEDITDENELYGGCIVKAYVNFFGYDYMGKRGISAGLLAICKVEDGEPLGSGMVNPKDVFGDVIQQRQEVDFNSREYNEGPGQRPQEWGDAGNMPRENYQDEPDDVPF